MFAGLVQDVAQRGIAQVGRDGYANAVAQGILCGTFRGAKEHG